VSRALALLAALAAALAVVVPAASASPSLQPGIYDEAQVLYGNPDKVFPVLKQLGVRIVRVSLYWNRVAVNRPANPADPTDPAYDWAVYDRTAQYAHQYGMNVLLSVWGTPPWANGGNGPSTAPTDPLDLRRFAFAAATRYGGRTIGADGRVLPAITLWLAWNEPNNPIYLSPQYRQVKSAWVASSPATYAKICQAVYNGVHATNVRGEKVACGATAPRGNNDPSSTRPSISPLAFMRGVYKAGVRSIDAWAHHPYYSSPGETPATPPASVNGAAPTAVTLGNIGTLVAQVTALWGGKPIWITEYGYQTLPPDPIFGVSLAKQAAYLTQAYAIAKANPRIDMLLWFLLRDEVPLSGWQSGLMTATGSKKPAFTAYQKTATALAPATR
jgi:hypothetical protein